MTFHLKNNGQINLNILDTLIAVAVAKMERNASSAYALECKPLETIYKCFVCAWLAGLKMQKEKKNII